jgi:uncharacterized protein (DUF4415 family)
MTQQYDGADRRESWMAKRKKSFKSGRGYTKKDWDAVQSPELTDEQMAKAKTFAEAFPDLAASIHRGRGPNRHAKKKGYNERDLRKVRDNPEWTKQDFAEAKPFAEVLPVLAASIRKGRGPNKAPTKKLVSLRLSGQVIEAYKAKGPGWQSRIDADLRRINKIK